jgi:hypothetical protein
MDTRDITLRLHDILRAAYSVRLPGPGCTAEASIESIDTVKAGLRGLLADLGDRDPPRLPPRVKASAAALPEGRIPGTRILVQHRRRGRVPAEAVGQPIRKPALTPRKAAERLFQPVVIVGVLGRDAGSGLVS